MALKEWFFHINRAKKLYRKWYPLANKLANKKARGKKLKIDVDLENCTCDTSGKSQCLDAKCVIERFKEYEENYLLKVEELQEAVLDINDIEEYLVYEFGKLEDFESLELHTIVEEEYEKGKHRLKIPSFYDYLAKRLFGVKIPFASKKNNQWKLNWASFYTEILEMDSYDNSKDEFINLITTAKELREWIKENEKEKHENKKVFIFSDKRTYDSNSPIPCFCLANEKLTVKTPENDKTDLIKSYLLSEDICYLGHDRGTTGKRALGKMSDDYIVGITTHYPLAKRPCNPKKCNPNKLNTPEAIFANVAKKNNVPIDNLVYVSLISRKQYKALVANYFFEVWKIHQKGMDEVDRLIHYWRKWKEFINDNNIVKNKR